MKNEWNDEQWQKKMDEGKFPPRGEDDTSGRAYRLLYEALGTPPEVVIPSGFADQVAAQVQSPSVQSARRPWALMLGVITLSLLLSALAVFLTFPTYFQYLLDHAEVIIFAVMLFLAVQAGDYWLIQRKQFTKALSALR